MSSKQTIYKLELVISNYVRNEYEKKYNKQNVPMALKYLMHRFSNKIIGCNLLTMKEDLDFFNALKTNLSDIKTLKLLFRASDHNFSVKKFHSMCDDQGATITIIQSDYGNIYGGYTSKSWKSTDIPWKDRLCTKDENAFLFLIKTEDELIQKKCPLIFKIKKDHHRFAVYHCSLFGPTFGLGTPHDIQIWDRCAYYKVFARHSDDFSKVGCCEHHSYDYSGHEDVSLCGGDYKDKDLEFKIMEYEVFQIN